MNNNLLKDKIQKEAVEAWINSNKTGTILAITGLGKSFIFLHALYTMPLDKSIEHIFLAEVTDRERDLNEEIKKYNEIFNRDVYKDYNLTFSTYQSAFKLKDKSYGLVGCDEIHDSLSEQYSKFYFNNNYDAIIGLTATLNKKIEYIIDGKKVTKGDLINQIAPICYTYTVNQGQLEGTSRKLNIYIINHQLDNIEKSIKAGSKFKTFYQTELAAYDYWDKQFKKSLFLEPSEGEDISKFETLKNIKIQVASNRRKDILYNLPSKIKIIKELLNNIKGKTIVFGNSIDSLLKITPNTVSSRKKKEQNDSIRDKFESDKINIIASFKKLEQGANLPNLDNVILHSYYSIEGKMVQRLGRSRLKGDEEGNVFILVTENTQEVKWLNNALEGFKDFNIIYCKDLNECLEKYRINGNN